MALTARIRDHMVNQLGYTIPTTAAVGNHNEIMALNTAKDTAIRAEQAIYSIIQTASMVGGRSRGGTQALLTAGGVPVMMAPQSNNPAPGQPHPSGYTIMRAPPHRGGLRFGNSQRVSVPQAISHDAGDVTGASQASSGVNKGITYCCLFATGQRLRRGSVQAIQLLDCLLTMV